MLTCLNANALVLYYFTLYYTQFLQSITVCHIINNDTDGADNKTIIIVYMQPHGNYLYKWEYIAGIHDWRLVTPAMPVFVNW
jgi:hypothetical protein